ncbi:MAG: glycosyltransferase family 4 protein [Sulfurospirillum sp.]
MKKYNIYYYHPLNLSFKSAQTIQVVKDYFYLSRLGYNIKLFGNYDDINDMKEIEIFIKNSNLKIFYSKKSKFNKILNKITFLYKILKDKNQKIIITRHYKKLKEITFFYFLLKKVNFCHEMHEESFAYFFSKSINKQKIKSLFKKVNFFIFTNQSQLEFYKKEFQNIPKNFVILYNGVEIEKFTNARFEKNFKITYLGQFNVWKNVELIFKSLCLLDKKYTLRIAGGKDDKQSYEYINGLIEKYNIDKKRINYLGYVKNAEVVKKVLDNSNVLLLPLGNNIQSKYLTSPMKLFEYMATNIPVVSIKYPSITSIIKNNEIYLSDDNANSFAQNIEKASIYDNKKIKLMNILSENFSYKKRSEKFDKYLQKELL